MTEKQKYWIHDVEGVYALVEGADQRDEWTKVRGWTEADEPGPFDQVHVVNENPEIFPGRLPFGAVEHWAGMGWSAGPPVPANETLNSAPVEQAAPVAEPAKTTKSPAAAGGEQKEK
jgi:hypothetical protein